MLKLLKKIFKSIPKKKEIKLTGRVFNMWNHTTWGNNIAWRKWKDRTIMGHYYNGFISCKGSRRLTLGDELRCRMGSGRVARFKIIEIEYCSDPRDMFFGKVEDLDYL